MPQKVHQGICAAFAVSFALRRWPLVKADVKGNRASGGPSPPRWWETCVITPSPADRFGRHAFFRRDPGDPPVFEPAAIIGRPLAQEPDGPAQPNPKHFWTFGHSQTGTLSDTAFASVTHPNSVTRQTGLLGLDSVFGVTDSNGTGQLSLGRLLALLFCSGFHGEGCRQPRSFRGDEALELLEPVEDDMQFTGT